MRTFGSNPGDAKYKLPKWIQGISEEVMKSYKKPKKELAFMWSEMIAGKIQILGPNELHYFGYSHYFLNPSIPIPASFKPYFGRTYVLGMMNNIRDLVGTKNSRGKRNKIGYKGTPYEKVIKNPHN